MQTSGYAVLAPRQQTTRKPWPLSRRRITPNVAVDVVHPEGVGLVPADRGGALQVLAFGCAAVGIIAVEIGLDSREDGGGLLEIEGF